MPVGTEVAFSLEIYNRDKLAFCYKYGRENKNNLVEEMSKHK